MSGRQVRSRGFAGLPGGALIGIGGGLGLVLGTILGHMLMGMLAGAALGTVAAGVVETLRRAAAKREG